MLDGKVCLGDQDALTFPHGFIGLQCDGVGGETIGGIGRGPVERRRQSRQRLQIHQPLRPSGPRLRLLPADVRAPLQRGKAAGGAAWKRAVWRLMYLQIAALCMTSAKNECHRMSPHATERHRISPNVIECH